MTEPLSTRSSGNVFADMDRAHAKKLLECMRRVTPLFQDVCRERVEREAELERLNPSPRHPDWDEEEAK